MKKGGVVAENTLQKERYIRVQIHFHPADHAEIEKLQEEGGYRTAPAMIRQALKLLKVYLGAKREGYRLQLAKGADVKEVVLLD